METTNPLTVNDDAIADEALDHLNASDSAYWTAIAENPHISEDYKKALELLQLNLRVAAIAGWTDIKIWNPHAIKKSYVGVNLAHPELGIHIPNYVESVDAIASLLDELDIGYQVMRWGSGNQKIGKYNIVFDGLGAEYQDKEAANYAWFDNLPLGLCKLLLAINPPPVTPRRQVEIKIIDDDGEIESQVLEATFG